MIHETAISSGIAIQNKKNYITWSQYYTKIFPFLCTIITQ